MAFNEDTFGIVFLNVDYESSLALCSLSKLHQSWCTDYLWKEKVKLDYPFWSSLRPLGNLTYHDYYLELYTQYYVTVGSERTLYTEVCGRRAMFRNSTRLIQYFMKMDDLLMDPTYLSIPAMKRFNVKPTLKSLLVSNRVNSSDVIIRGHVAHHELEYTFEGELLKLDSFAFDVGRGGNLELIDKIKNVSGTGVLETMLGGAAYVGNYSLYKKLGGALLFSMGYAKQYPVKWIIVNGLIKHTAQSYGITDINAHVVGGKFEAYMFNILELVFTRPSKSDPNFLIDQDESCQNLLTEYKQFYHNNRGLLDIERVYKYWKKFRPLGSILLVEFFPELINLTWIIKSINNSDLPITMARYLIEKKLTHPTQLLSIAATLDTDVFTIKYLIQWLKSIQDSVGIGNILLMKDPLYHHITPFTYVVDGKEYMGDSIIGHYEVDKFIKVIKEVHGIEGGVIVTENGNILLSSRKTLNPVVTTYAKGKGKVTYTHRGITKTIGLTAPDKTVNDLLEKIAAGRDLFDAKYNYNSLYGGTILYPGMVLDIDVADGYIPSRQRTLEAIHDTNRVFSYGDMVIFRLTIYGVGKLLMG